MRSEAVMTGKQRLGVARLWYEGNAFCLIPAARPDFERREWAKGSEALRRSQGIETELAAVADFAAGRPDWEVVVSRCASALPAGPIDHRLFEDFVAEVLADFVEMPPDAIYLSLHGAAITSEDDQPELTFVAALRAVHAGVPLAASFDMHANHAPALIQQLAISSGYRTHPHVDMRATAARALDGLDRLVRGEIHPVVAFRHGDLMLSSTNMRTDSGPMAELQREAMARIVPPIIDAAVFGGFPYADSRNNAASVVVWADGDAQAAAATADALYAALVARAPAFDVDLPGASVGIAEALAADGLVAVTEAADNPLSGGIGDTPGLFRALMDTAPSVSCVFASFADPDVVAQATAAGVGADINIRLGGKRTTLYGPPVPLRATVAALTDGRFVNSGPMEYGRAVECGRTAMLRTGQIRVIVCEHVAPANDPGLLTLHGIDLAEIKLLCVKAKNHFRAAFAPLCTRIIDVETPGPASLDVKNLPLRRRRMAATNG
jgi:microcystin degradation protein MlrC